MAKRRRKIALGSKRPAEKGRKATVSIERSRNAVFVGNTTAPKHKKIMLEREFGEGNVFMVEESFNARGKRLVGFKAMYVKIPAFIKARELPHDWLPWESNMEKPLDAFGEVVQ